MDSGVHDEPAGAPGIEREHPETVDVARVETHLVGEMLGVERPALDVGGHSLVLPELGNAGQLLGDRDLEMMAGNRFVKRQRLGLVARPRLGHVGIDHVGARPLPVRRGSPVVGDGRIGRLVHPHHLHLAGLLGLDPEPLRALSLPLPPRS